MSRSHAQDRRIFNQEETARSLLRLGLLSSLIPLENEGVSIIMSSPRATRVFLKTKIKNYRRLFHFQNYRRSVEGRHLRRFQSESFEIIIKKLKKKSPTLRFKMASLFSGGNRALATPKIVSFRGFYPKET